jgi:hypothetical protein
MNTVIFKRIAKKCHAISSGTFPPRIKIIEKIPYIAATEKT